MLKVARGTWSVCFFVITCFVGQIAFAEAYCPSVDEIKFVLGYATAQNGKWRAKTPIAMGASTTSTVLQFELALETMGDEMTDPLNPNQQAYVSPTMQCTYHIVGSNPSIGINLSPNSGNFYVVPVNSNNGFSGKWESISNTAACEAGNVNECPFELSNNY